MSPFAGLRKGIVAGAVGTAVMTAVQTAYYKASGSESSSVPAEVARRIVEGVLDRKVPEERMGLLNNAMHWTYGLGWGALYGLWQSSRGTSSVRDGFVFAALVWGTSQLHLPAMKLAPPAWQYPPSQLALDAGFHLAYGTGVAGAYRALD